MLSVEPMLARWYNPNGFCGAVDTQPKVDGWRCLAVIEGGAVRCYTRSGADLALPAIGRELLALWGDGRPVVVDGEVYVPGGTAADTAHAVAADPTALRYAPFDVFDPADPFAAWTDRRQWLQPFTGRLVRAVETQTAHSADDVERHMVAALADGFEGLILRWRHAAYHGGRTNALQKFKRRRD